MCLTVEWKIATSELAAQLGLNLFGVNQKPFAHFFSLLALLVVLPMLIPLSCYIAKRTKYDFIETNHFNWDCLESWLCWWKCKFAEDIRCFSLYVSNHHMFWLDMASLWQYWSRNVEQRAKGQDGGRKKGMDGMNEGKKTWNKTTSQWARKWVSEVHRVLLRPWIESLTDKHGHVPRAEN